jgi:hypothetical protein
MAVYIEFPFSNTWTNFTCKCSVSHKQAVIAAIVIPLGLAKGADWWIVTKSWHWLWLCCCKMIFIEVPSCLVYISAGCVSYMSMMYTYLYIEEWSCIDDLMPSCIYVWYFYFVIKRTTHISMWFTSVSNSAYAKVARSLKWMCPFIPFGAWWFC